MEQVKSVSSNPKVKSGLPDILTSNELQTIDLRGYVTDNLFRELGKVSYTLEDAISEFIDNSIQAKVGSKVNVDVRFFFKGKGACNRIEIQDDASGISLEKIPHSIVPASDAFKNGGLNEHGLGLKAASEALGVFDFMLTKTEQGPCYRVNGPLSFSLKLAEVNAPFERGTQLSILINSKDKNLVDFYASNKVNTNNSKMVKKFNWILGARYRHFLHDGSLKLTVHLCSENNQEPHVIEPVFPLYYHPWKTTPSPIISKKEFISGGLKAWLTFGYAPKEAEEYEKLGLNIANTEYEVRSGTATHPYQRSQKNAGFDVIIHNRVIGFSQLEEIGVVTKRIDWHNQIRGEIVFEGNISTLTTKNGITESYEYSNIKKEISNYLNGRHKDNSTNWINHDYIKKGVPDYHTEAELEKKMMDQFMRESKRYGFKEPESQFSIDGTGLKIDILYRDEIYELKSGVADGQSIAQLVLYMILKKIKKGYLVAMSFAPPCKKIVEDISSELGFEVILSNPKDFIDFNDSSSS